MWMKTIIDNTFTIQQRIKFSNVQYGSMSNRYIRYWGYVRCSSEMILYDLTIDP